MAADQGTDLFRQGLTPLPRPLGGRLSTQPFRKTIHCPVPRSLGNGVTVFTADGLSAPSSEGQEKEGPPPHAQACGCPTVRAPPPPPSPSLQPPPSPLLLLLPPGTRPCLHRCKLGVCIQNRPGLGEAAVSAGTDHPPVTSRGPATVTCHPGGQGGAPGSESPGHPAVFQKAVERAVPSVPLEKGSDPA